MMLTLLCERTSGSQARLVESRHCLAVSRDTIARALLRVTRGRRIIGGSDREETAGWLACADCGQRIGDHVDWMRLHDRAYHVACWERVQADAARDARRHG